MEDRLPFDSLGNWNEDMGFMALSPHIDRIIAEVEELSGRKVVVREDSSLRTLASVQIARGAAPFHLVRYRASGDTTNYLLLYQLAFLVRLFSRPAGERWEVGATPEENEAGSSGLGMSALEPQLGTAMLDTLLTQLRTYPVGLRIDAWIRRDFPDLREEQVTSVRMQLAENERALDPEIRSRFPKGLVDANSGMNAAYARFWSGQLDDPRYSVPFVALGYDGVADELGSALRDIPDDPTEDRRLIESWAGILGLTGYFHFQTHQFDD